MGWSNKKNLGALSYEYCDEPLRLIVHKGHDMKLPLSYHAIRMKEFNDYKAGVYQGDSPGVEHDPQAKRGVPDDGLASEDENYSPGKNKDKEIKSKSRSSALTKTSASISALALTPTSASAPTPALTTTSASAPVPASAPTSACARLRYLFRLRLLPLLRFWPSWQC